MAIPAPPAPSSPPLAAIPPTREPASPWVKLLIGCGIGCGVLVLAAIGAGIYGSWWLLTPGEQVATEGVVGPDSAAVVHLSGDRAAAGLSKLIAHAFRELQRLNRRRHELPKPLRWLERMQELQQQQATAQGVGIWVPHELTFTAITSDGVEPHDLVVAANFRQLIRPVRAIFLRATQAEGDAISHEYRDSTIIELEEGGAALCFHGGTLLLTSRLEAMKQVIDRLEEVVDLEKQPRPEQIFAGYESLKAVWAVCGVLDNQEGLLSELLTRSGLSLAEHDELREPLERISAARFGLTIESEDAVRGELLLDADAADQAVLSERLGAALARLEGKLAAQGLTLEHHVEERDGLLVASVSLSGLADAMTTWLDQSIEEEAG